MGPWDGWPETATVGPWDGRAEGAKEGTSEGKEVGPWEGGDEGLIDGWSDAKAVGPWDGTTKKSEGELVVPSDGIDEGLMDDCPDIVTLETWDGSDDGAKEGKFEGGKVGPGDGKDDGAGPGAGDHVHEPADHVRARLQGRRGGGRPREGHAGHVRVGAVQGPDRAGPQGGLEVARAVRQQHRAVHLKRPNEGCDLKEADGTFEKERKNKPDGCRACRSN